MSRQCDPDHVTEIGGGGISADEGHVTRRLVIGLEAPRYPVKSAESREFPVTSKTCRPTRDLPGRAKV